MNQPEQWGNTPIVRPFSSLTGYLEGEDGDNPSFGNPGYRGMKTVDSTEPLVVPAGVRQRSVFDGHDEYGAGYTIRTLSFPEVCREEFSQSANQEPDLLTMLNFL